MKKSIKVVLGVAVAAALGCACLAGCSSSNSSSSSSESSASTASYVVVDELSSEHYAVGFKLGDDATAAAITAALVQLDADGTVKELCEKYADQGISYDNWCLTATDTSALENAGSKTLIVGFDAEYPPYGYIADDGSYTGFDLDLAQAACDLLGWEFKAEPIDWDSKDALIDSGQITCIWNGFTYEGRESDYAFSDCYMLNAQVVVVKAGSDVASVDDLAGKAVMTQSGSAAFELLQGDLADVAATFGDLTAVPDYSNAFMSLESGAVDAVACDYSVAAYYGATTK